MVFWYFEYVNFNSIGVRFVVLILWVVIIGVVRRIFLRFFIFLVLMGYGVVRFIFGGFIFKVFVIGVIYFLVTELLDIIEYVGIINDILGRVRLFFVLFDLFLDVFLILWIFIFFLKMLE